MMVLDIPEERGLAEADVIWGNPKSCHFPLLEFITPLPLQWMCIVYAVMWAGAVGIMLGIFYKLSCIAFIIPYGYIFLLDKCAWNNHSYLYGVTAVLLLGTGANHYCSLDIFFGKVKWNTHVPLWNYAILRFQFFILYFFAGLKKMDQDWLDGYSMANLSNHWLFEPLKLFMTSEQIDYWIIHQTGFLLDITVGFLLFVDKTRPYAIFICSMFHVINSRLFSIGMFPYVCLVTLPLFCHADWPRRINIFTHHEETTKLPPKQCFCETCACLGHQLVKNAMPCDVSGEVISQRKITKSSCVTWKQTIVTALLLSHMGFQTFLPFSHFVTKGLNNWTNGLYGYSWDMMVHSWDTVLVVVKIVDNNTGKEYFIDSTEWVHSDKWTKHADMVKQYAKCVKNNIIQDKEIENYNNGFIKNGVLMSINISVYIDVWSSLNGRIHQRMFDPRVDLLKAEWSLFNSVSWLMPLLTEFDSWRVKMKAIEEEVYSWSNYTDVFFVADFPGFTLENYISPDLANVTVTVLSGSVRVEKEQHMTAQRYNNATFIKEQILNAGQSTAVPSGTFHKVHTISAGPSSYMYIYFNETKQLNEQSGNNEEPDSNKTVEPGIFGCVLKEIRGFIRNVFKAINFIINAILNIIFSVPMDVGTKF
ncbi:vitamin K-dependent gamma-carboxylase isoform X2 [Bacillus rossius redtenbacheri]